MFSSFPSSCTGALDQSMTWHLTPKDNSIGGSRGLEEDQYSRDSLNFVGFWGAGRKLKHLEPWSPFWKTSDRSAGGSNRMSQLMSGTVTATAKLARAVILQCHHRRDSLTHFKHWCWIDISFFPASWMEKNEPSLVTISWRGSGDGQLMVALYSHLLLQLLGQLTHNDQHFMHYSLLV